MYICARIYALLDISPKDVSVKNFVLYIISALWAIVGLSDYAEKICREGAVSEAAAPTSFISAPLSSEEGISEAMFLGTTSNSVNSYATKNNHQAKEDAKHKNQNKSAILGQNFYKSNSIHSSNELSFGLVSPERALYVLNFLCRLNV